jgi:hypothetical protein
MLAQLDSNPLFHRMEERVSSPVWRAGTAASPFVGALKKSGPISGATVQRGRKAGSQGRLCKVSFCKAERRFGSCREQWVVVKVISSKRPLLLFRIYALPEPKEFVTTPCDLHHGKLLSQHGLKTDIELCEEWGHESRECAEMHIAAHWLQSTAFSFPFEVKTRRTIWRGQAKSLVSC